MKLGPDVCLILDGLLSRALWFKNAYYWPKIKIHNMIPQCAICVLYSHPLTKSIFQGSVLLSQNRKFKICFSQIIQPEETTFQSQAFVDLLPWNLIICEAQTATTREKVQTRVICTLDYKKKYTKLYFALSNGNKLRRQRCFLPTLDCASGSANLKGTGHYW